METQIIANQIQNGFNSIETSSLLQSLTNLGKHHGYHVYKPEQHEFSPFHLSGWSYDITWYDEDFDDELNVQQFRGLKMVCETINNCKKFFVLESFYKLQLANSELKILVIHHHTEEEYYQALLWCEFAAKSSINTGNSNFLLIGISDESTLICHQLGEDENQEFKN